MTGDLKDFLFHQAIDHLNVRLDESLGGLLVLQKKNFEFFRQLCEKNYRNLVNVGFSVTCPFCRLQITFNSKEGFRDHLNQLHNDELDERLSVQKIVIFSSNPNETFDDKIKGRKRKKIEKDHKLFEGVPLSTTCVIEQANGIIDTKNEPKETGRKKIKNSDSLKGTFIVYCLFF